MKNTDIVIVGAGIAGLTSAIYLKRANANFIILENSLPGGLLNQLKTVENYPGFQKTSGQQIMLSLMEQIRSLGIEIKYGSVQTILKEKDGFEVVSDVDSYECKAVIVASGRQIPSVTIKNEQKYNGKGVSYCATCDGNFYKGYDVAVIGNNEIVLEESLYLAGLAKNVYLICSEEKLEGTKSLIEKIENTKNIKTMTNSVAEEIVGNDDFVTGIVVNKKLISVEGVFPYVGKKGSDDILNNLKPEKDNFGYIVNQSMNSNIPGLFFAGDVNNKKLKQLITAASDGAIAATNAYQYIKMEVTK